MITNLSEIVLKKVYKVSPDSPGDFMREFGEFLSHNRLVFKFAVCCSANLLSITIRYMF